MLRDRTMSAAETTLAAHAAAMHVVQRLDEIGVDDAVVLKGCATAHLDYERAADRFSSDVDLMVPGDRIADVVAAFERARPCSPPGAARWNRRYGHATTLKGFNGVDLDVHVRVAQAYVGLSIPPDELRIDTAPFSIGGTPMRGLDGPNRLIHAAVHSRSVNIGLHSKRDVPQLVLVSGVDWEEAIRRAERWQIGHFFALGVLAAWRSFDLPDHPLTDWAEQHQPTGRRGAPRRPSRHRPPPRQRHRRPPRTPRPRVARLHLAPALPLPRLRRRTRQGLAHPPPDLPLRIPPRLTAHLPAPTVGNVSSRPVPPPGTKRDRTPWESQQQPTRTHRARVTSPAGSRRVHGRPAAPNATKPLRPTMSA